MPRPSTFSITERLLLEDLFVIHGEPEKGYGGIKAYCKNLCDVFNSISSEEQRSVMQIRNYAANRKHKIKIKKEEDIEYKGKRKRQQPKSSPVLPENETEHSDDVTSRNTSTSTPLSSPLVQDFKSTASIPKNDVIKIESDSKQHDSYRSLSDDLPKSWEFRELTTHTDYEQGGESDTLNDETVESKFLDDDELSNRTEPQSLQHLLPINFSEISAERVSPIQGKNGMSGDLVKILAEQAREHHKLKIRLLKEKQNRALELHSLKMGALEMEINMKQNQHTQKMTVLAKKLKKYKNDDLEI